MMKVKLKDVASFSKGQQINGDDLLPSANYAYLNGGISPSGYWNEYNIPANSIAISEGGNSCGYVNYMQTPFWCGAHCYYLFDLKICNGEKDVLFFISIYSLNSCYEKFYIFISILQWLNLNVFHTRTQ